METNSKDVFWSFKIFWKFGISIVHTNMYSCAKVGMKTQTRKNHTKVTNFRCRILSFSVQLYMHLKFVIFVEFFKSKFASQLLHVSTYLYAL